jgi:hypothetical protein
VRICAAKSRVSLEDATRIVDIVRKLRGLESLQQRPSLRAGIMIATVARREGARPIPGDVLFQELCADILGNLMLEGGRCIDPEWLAALIDEHVAPSAQQEV